MTILDLFLLVTALGAFAHAFVLRHHVIGLIRAHGLFESLGSPGGLNFADALPIRSLSIANLSPKEHRWVISYFVSWVLHWLLVVAILLKVFVDPANAIGAA